MEVYRAPDVYQMNNFPATAQRAGGASRGGSYEEIVNVKRKCADKGGGRQRPSSGEQQAVLKVLCLTFVPGGEVPELPHCGMVVVMMVVLENHHQYR
ncbi:hypothetical protein E2C01_041415 [Portunus trituberculatus]|uniref:Uncharacterized protein n=1 Tax=Portunus trituberculatus TaxID=210409 RepID=A0A5B7FMJ6_PORTR|nr:hypothetical protein [Portunus trituberculatus]